MRKKSFYVLIMFFIVACHPGKSSSRPTKDLIQPETPVNVVTPSLQALINPTESQTGSSDIAATLSANNLPEILQIFPSPDKKWEIQIKKFACQKIGELDEYSLEELVLFDQVSGEETRVYSQLINCGGVGAFGIGGNLWSANSRYFYFTNAREGVPDGCCEYYWSQPVARLDIQENKIKDLGYGIYSANDRQLATIVNNGLTIWDIDHGSETHFALLNLQLGIAAIAWSPDNSRLVYLQVDSLFVPGISKIVLVEIKASKQVELSTEDFPIFTNVEWKINDQLELTTADGQKWVYTFSTKDLQNEFLSAKENLINLLDFTRHGGLHRGSTLNLAGTK